MNFLWQFGNPTQKQQEEQNDKILKVVILGGHQVGKSTLLRTYQKGNFRPTYVPTVGIDIHKIRRRIPGKNQLVQFWDVSHMELGCPQEKIIFHHVHGVFYCLDPSNFISVRSIDEWRGVFSKYQDVNNPVPCFLIFTKSDLASPNRPLLSNFQLKRFCGSSGIQGFVRLSAKDKVMVQNEFESMLNHCAAFAKNQSSKTCRVNGFSPRMDMEPSPAVFTKPLPPLKTFKIEDYHEPLCQEFQTKETILFDLRKEMDAVCFDLHKRLREKPQEWPECSEEIELCTQQLILRKTNLEAKLATLEHVIRERTQNDRILNPGNEPVRLWSFWHAVDKEVKHVHVQTESKLKNFDLLQDLLKSSIENIQPSEDSPPEENLEVITNTNLESEDQESLNDGGITPVDQQPMSMDIKLTS